MLEQAIGRLWILAPAAVAALGLSWGLIVLLRPFLLRHAVAPPSARSSHKEPTPQGGGIAVVGAAMAVTWCALAMSPTLVESQTRPFLVLTAAVALMTLVGAVDDMHPLPAAVRLFAQCLAVGGMIIMLPDEIRLLPQVPWWAERVGLLIGGVWFVNLVNFMDGVDWMTVAELTPVTGAIVLIGLIGTVGLMPAVLAAALLGAILGFAPFNKPVAKLFLGDVGSLPAGLLVAWLLLELAAVGHLAAAIILPLYYLADATITLAGRIARGEPFWQAHRMHFYQRATDRGFTVPQVVSRVFLVNLALGAMALVTIASSDFAVAVAALAAAAALVATLLLSFVHGKR